MANDLVMPEQLPPPSSREELRTQLGASFQERGLSPGEIEEALDFFEEYEKRYYEVVGEGTTYHRQCGGKMVQDSTGVHCPNCGSLPDLIPPQCIRVCD